MTDEALAVVSFVLGPVGTNAYLVADPATGDAAVIDPAWDGQVIVDEARRRGWRLQGVWPTHAHFAHLRGRVCWRTPRARCIVESRQP